MNKDQLDVYAGTIDRLEPNIASVDAGAYHASAAISAKRQADALERIADTLEWIRIEINNR